MAKNRDVQVLPDTVEGEPVYRVELTKGYWAVVDRDVWPRVLAEYGTRWTAVHNGRNHVYAKARYRLPNGRRETMPLARAVAGATGGARIYPVNGDSLDLRRSNLMMHGRLLNGGDAPARPATTKPKPKKRKAATKATTKAATKRTASQEPASGEKTSASKPARARSPKRKAEDAKAAATSENTPSPSTFKPTADRTAVPRERPARVAVRGLSEPAKPIPDDAEVIHEDARSVTTRRWRPDSQSRSEGAIFTIAKSAPCLEYRRRLRAGEPMNGLDPCRCFASCKPCSERAKERKGYRTTNPTSKPLTDVHPLDDGLVRCAACGEVFESAEAFDRHRIGRNHRRTCRQPAQAALSIRMCNAGSYWVFDRDSIWRRELASGPAPTVRRLLPSPSTT